MKPYILLISLSFFFIQVNAQKPNVIILMADDMGYNDIGAFGQQFMKTPNIDNLAKEGMKFTDCYAGSSVCSPSRSVLLTGLHTGHTTIRGNATQHGGKPGPRFDKVVHRANLTEDNYTIGNLMQKAGYKTGLIGKWHLGGYATTASPIYRGFDEFYGWLTITPETYFPTYWPEKRYRNCEIYDINPNKGGKKGYYSTDIVTDEAISFLENNYSGPFFLSVNYTNPHIPLDAPDLSPFENENWPEHIKIYGSMIYKLDQSVGKIVKTIEKLGLSDNTILFFCSDNGPNSNVSEQITAVAEFFDSNGKLRGYKRDLYEGGIRVPMIVWSPGYIKPGTINSTPWYFADFMPTLAEIAEVNLEVPTDGISIYSAILGKNEPNKERFMYWEFFQYGFEQAVRFGKWKAVKTNGIMELYDLTTDIGEQNDIANQHPEVIETIENYLAMCRTESPFWTGNKNNNK